MQRFSAYRPALTVYVVVLLSLLAGFCSRATGGAATVASPSRHPATKNAMADALLSAIDSHDIDGVRTALRDGADPNGPGRGHRVLGEAVWADDPVIVRELIKAGANVNAATVDGGAVPMLQLAALHNDRAVVRILLQAGAKPDARSGSGVDALAQAAIADANLVCEPLVQAGADINSWTLWPTNLYAGVVQTTPPKRGRTPLMIAASLGHWKTVGALLSLGADEKLTNERGETALSLAGEIENPIEILRSFLSNPARLRPVRR